MSVSNTMEGTVSMKIYTVLKGEHREVRALFKSIKATPSNDMFTMLCNELLSHAKAEQETVYNRASERIGSEHLTQATEEHQEIEQLIASLKQMDTGSDEWKSQLAILQHRVEEHVKHEESMIFDEMKKAFSDKEAKEIAKEFHDAKNRELEALKT